jgi:hypothetical protein
MDEWVELDLDGNFRVQAPADAKAGLRDGGSRAAIDLGDATEVLISNLPLAKAMSDAAALRDEVAQFFNEALPKARFSIEVEEDQSLVSAQGVGVIQKDRVTLARAYARRGDDRFWLLHWTGPKEKTSTVLRIFVTFDPAE